MSPKAKNKSFPPVKVTEEFLERAKKCADYKDEYLSDFIRKAVEFRMNDIEFNIPVDSTHKNNTYTIKDICGVNDVTLGNNTVSKEEKYWDEVNNRPMNPVDNKENYDKSVKAKAEYRAEQKQSKSTMVKTFGKGGNRNEGKSKL